jgi:ribose transport system substrate-binding protein
MTKTRQGTFAKVALAAAVAVGLGTAAPAEAKDKYLIFYSASYYGNDWQAEATNMMKAMADYYRDKIDFKIQVAGASAQRQIQQMSAMIQAGADAIVAYPISPTALNKVAKAACDKGVMVISYDSEMTEPCTYIVKVDAVQKGRETAQWLVDQLGGKGNIVVITGVAGTTYNEDIIKGSNEVLSKYPDINVLAEVNGEWEQSVAKIRMTEVLATHSWDEIDGLLVQTGCWVLTQMQMDAGIPADKVRPCAGEAANGHRVMMLPEGTVDGAIGLRSYSAGSAPWGGAYALKLALQKLEGQDIGERWKRLPHGPVTTDGATITTPNGEVVQPGKATLCQTGSREELEAGCNVVNPDIVPATWYADFWNPLVPEIGLNAALVGQPEEKP